MVLNSEKLTDPLDNIRTSAEVLLEGAFGRLGGDQRENVKLIYTNAGALFALFMDIISHIGIENVVKRANLRHKFDELSQPIHRATQELLHQLDGPVNEEQVIALEYISSLIETHIIHADTLWLYAALNHKHIQASLRAFPLVQLIDEMTDEFIDIPLKVEWESPDTAVRVFADPLHIRRCLRELIANAVSHKMNTPPILRITSHITHIQFCVIDDGIGIDPDYQDVIFDPFFQIVDHDEGLGLGLTIARQLLLLHNSPLTVESQIGFGSKFIFTLPLV